MEATLDPLTALVVIDLQKALQGLQAAPHLMADVIDRAAALAAAFRSRDLPVVLVNATGRPPGRTEQRRNATSEAAPPADWADLIDALDAQPDDHRVTKKCWGAFHGTDLDLILRERGVTQIVLAGVATSLGVESTARAAYEHGYNVLLAIDAMTDRDPEAHANSVDRVFPKLGENATTAEILETIGS